MKGSVCAFFLFMLIASALGSWTAYYNNTILASAGQSQLKFPITGYTSFTTFHCIGGYDWYIGFNRVPTTSSYDSYIAWQGYNYEYASIGINATSGTLYFLFVCISSNQPFCSTFNLVEQNSDDISDFLAIPSTTSPAVIITNGGRGANVTWTKTNNPNDTYSVYWQTTSPPSGYSYASACSVRLWMNPFTSSQGTISYNAGNFTAAITLIPSGSYTILALANRNNGISGVYDAVIFGGGYRTAPHRSMKTSYHQQGNMLEDLRATALQPSVNAV